MTAPFTITIDASGNVWAGNSFLNTLSEFNSSGTAISPSIGYSFFGYRNDPIDASGNVWSEDPENNALIEMIGVARPVLTPQVACLRQPTPSAVCLP